eukprot:c18892_g1_i1 orf=27-320(-)
MHTHVWCALRSRKSVAYAWKVFVCDGCICLCSSVHVRVCACKNWYLVGDLFGISPSLSGFRAVLVHGRDSYGSFPHNYYKDIQISEGVHSTYTLVVK